MTLPSSPRRLTVGLFLLLGLYLPDLLPAQTKPETRSVFPDYAGDRIVGLPSSRNASPLINRYLSLPPFRAALPSEAELFVLPQLSIGQLFTASYFYLDGDSEKYIDRQFDYEALSLELPLLVGLGDGVAVGVDLQFQLVYGGFLDGIIDAFHGLIGFVTSGREKMRRDEVEVDFQSESGFSLTLQHPAFLVSDPQVFFAFSVLRERNFALSASVMASVPLGLSLGLAGTELPQFGLGASVDWFPLSWLAVYGSLGFFVPLDSVISQSGEYSRPFVQARLSSLFSFAPEAGLFVDLTLRSSAIKSAYRDSSDSDYYAQTGLEILVGFVFTPETKSSVAFSVQEDLASSLASDVGFLWSGGFAVE